MSNVYALVSGGAVENVVVADEAYVKAVKNRYEAVVQLAETDNVNIGDLYDAATKTIKKRATTAPVEPAPVVTVISLTDFRARFTVSELAALYESDAPVAVLFRDELKAYELTGSVDLGSDRLAELVDLLPEDILDAERKVQVLAR